MSLAVWPLAHEIMSIHAVPAGIRIPVTILIVAGIWWGPFGYAMYLSQVVVPSGDRRLLERGIPGTARVLSVKRTNEVIHPSQFAWHAPWVCQYTLRVSIPGHAPYDTTCRMWTSDIAEGSTVWVAASPRNKRRVTIDIGQGSTRAAAVPGAEDTGSRVADLVTVD